MRGESLCTSPEAGEFDVHRAGLPCGSPDPSANKEGASCPGFPTPSCFFACSPCRSQDEALTGGKRTSPSRKSATSPLRLTFGEGGGFQLDQVIAASDDFLLAEAGERGSPIEELTAQGTGTYRVEGDSLFADLTEVSKYVDGRDFVEVMTEFARAFARIAADLGGVSDEDYPAFEQAAVEKFLADFNPEEEFLGDFTGNLGTYRIDGNTLSITTLADGEVDTVKLMRIDSSTAVARITLGILKAKQ